jgi:hypothetical protein
MPDDSKLKEFSNRIREIIKRNMGAEGTRLMALMKARTPYRNGALKGSGQSQGPDYEGNDIIVVLSFGSDTVHYAIPVHERINVRHRHGRAKFMESVIQEESSNIGPNLAKDLR